MRHLTYLVAICLILASGSMIEAAPRTITVTGTAKDAVRPDRAQLLVTIETKAASMAALQSAHQKAIEKVLSASRGIQPDEGKINLSHTNFEPRYKKTRESKSLIAYFAYSRLTLHTDALNTVPQALETLSKSGATRVMLAGYDIADPQPILDKVQGDAVKHAEKKATMLAKTAGANSDVS